MKLLKIFVLRLFREQFLPRIFSVFIAIFFLCHIVGNKLICHCNLTWIRTLKTETSSLGIQNALTNLNCFMENETMTISQNEKAKSNITLNQGEKLVSSFALANVGTIPQPYHYFSSFIFKTAVKLKTKNEAIPTKGKHVLFFYLGQAIFNAFTHRFL